MVKAILKTFVLLIIFGHLTGIEAQEKSVEFELSGKQKLVFNQTTLEGNSALVIWNKKGSENNTEIFNYDRNLDLKYKTTVTSKFKDKSGYFGGAAKRKVVYYELFLTRNGKYAFSNTDRFLLNNMGEFKAYNFDDDNESDKIEDLISFRSEDYTCFIGPKLDKGRRSSKPNDIYFFRRNNNDLSKQIFSFPKTYYGEKEYYHLSLAGVGEDNFYTVVKDLNEENTVNTYHLVSYNYNAEVNSNISIKVKLDKKFFMSSNNGGGQTTISSHNSNPFSSSGDILNNMSTTTHRLDADSTGNIFIDEANEVVYIYGLYTNKKDDDFYNASFGGFYIHKYRFTGEVIWKSQNAIVDRNDFNKVAVTYFVNVDFFKINENQLGFSVSKSNTKKYVHFFLLNDSDGEVEKNKKMKFEVNQLRFAGMKQGLAFPAGHQIKSKFGNAYLDLRTLFATYINPEINNYLYSNKKEALNYKTTVSLNGIYILEENEKENKYKLMKFE